MAFKNESEVSNLVNDLTDMKSGVQHFVNGYLLDRVMEAGDANDVGDDTPEQQAVARGLDAVITAAGTLDASINDVIVNSYGALGRLGGASDPSDTDEALAEFQQFLIGNGKALTGRNFSRTASVVSKAGDGKLVISLTDLNGSEIDVGHIDDLIFRCTQDATDGATAGREEFTVEGSSEVYPNIREGNAGGGRSYEHEYGLVEEDFNSRINSLITDDSFRAFGANTSAGNKIRNGDFNIFGGTVPDRWTVLSGDAADITAHTSDPISNLNNSASVVDDIVIENIFTRNRLRNGVPYALGTKLRTDNGGAGTVTGFVDIFIMSRDESETYATLTVDLSTLTAGNPGTVEVVDPVIFLMPREALDPKVKVHVRNLGGTAATPTVILGDVSVGDTVLVDGIIAAVYSGDHYVNSIPQGRFKYGDRFKVETTGGQDGRIQKYYVNEPSGRYLVSSGTGVAPWA